MSATVHNADLCRPQFIGNEVRIFCFSSPQSANICNIIILRKPTNKHYVKWLESSALLIHLQVTCNFFFEWLYLSPDLIYWPWSVASFVLRNCLGKWCPVSALQHQVYQVKFIFCSAPVMFRGEIHLKISGYHNILCLLLHYFVRDHAVPVRTIIWPSWSLSLMKFVYFQVCIVPSVLAAFTLCNFMG
jgi:hypothetical protein